MNKVPGAVFVSYASQDRDAAARICDALRAAGLEVWFDQSELRGGDAWDASIRKQVRECAFFVPIISANTNARSEGYFRREWHLAVQRMLDMAEDQPFLLPVVIDDTQEPSARVPDRFRERQWSRVTNASSANIFAAHAVRLAGATGPAGPVPKVTTAPEPDSHRTSRLLEMSRGERLLSQTYRYVRQRWVRITVLTALGAGAVAVGGHMLGGISGIWESYKVVRDKATALGVVAPDTPRRPFRSLAVLPFTDDGKDAENRRISQSFARDLTNSMRRVHPDMFVVPNGSVQPYRDERRDLKTIGKDLNVRYLVEGHVRGDGHLREISLELIDTIDGTLVWSSRAEVAASTLAETVTKLRHAMRVALINATKNEIASLPPKQRAAWELVLRAWNEGDAIEDIKRMQQLSEEALRIDPDFAQALRMLVYILFQRVQDEPSLYPELRNAMDEYSARAVRVAPADPAVWLARSTALRLQGNMSGAFVASDEAMRIDPINPSILQHRGGLLIYAGRPLEALPLLAQAEQLDPSDYTMTDVLVWRCVAYFHLRRDEDAAVACERAAALWNRWMIYAALTALYAEKGNENKAAFWKKKLVAANPRVTIARVRDMAQLNSNEAAWSKQAERWAVGLRKAGIAEN